MPCTPNKYLPFNAPLPSLPSYFKLAVIVPILVYRPRNPHPWRTGMSSHTKHYIIYHAVPAKDRSVLLNNTQTPLQGTAWSTRPATCEQPVLCYVEMNLDCSKTFPLTWWSATSRALNRFTANFAHAHTDAVAYERQQRGVLPIFSEDRYFVAVAMIHWRIISTSACTRKRQPYLLASSSTVPSSRIPVHCPTARSTTLSLRATTISLYAEPPHPSCMPLGSNESPFHNRPKASCLRNPLISIHDTHTNQSTRGTQGTVPTPVYAGRAHYHISSRSMEQRCQRNVADAAGCLDVLKMVYV